MKNQIKIYVLLALCVAGAIALHLVNRLINDRALTRQEVANEINQTSGGVVELFTPILVVDYLDTPSPAAVDGSFDGGTRVEVADPVASAPAPATLARSTAALLPTQAAIDISTSVQTRFRGIVPARISSHQVNHRTTFSSWQSKFTQQVISARLVLFVGSHNAVKTATATFDGQTIEFRSAEPLAWAPSVRALSIDIPAGRIFAGAPLAISTALTISGGDTLQVTPLARASTVASVFNWPHVKFMSKLPDSREFESNAVRANWQASTLSAVLQDSYSGSRLRELSSAMMSGHIDVRFIEPLDVFSLLDRSTKFGMLIVVVTLGFLLLFDVTRDTRMHLVQYGVVTFGLVLFFMLLLSISEHAGFNIAYAVGATAITVLSSGYLFFVFRSLKLGSSFAGYFGTCYAALYIIMRSEDYALVLGSLLLLAGLTAAMWFTRSLHWRNFDTSV
jgi:inner membrane protein